LLRQLAGVVGLPPSLVPSTAPAPPPVRGGPKLRVRYTKGASPNPRAKNLISLAKEYLGVKYQWGGETPQGWDCSGFVQWLYGQQGVQVPRTSQEQWRAGTPIDRSQLQPGDVVFFHLEPTGPTHEGLYLGGGKFAHAPHTGDVTKISSLNSRYYRQAFAGARRFAP
jgi:cell wall-associated NlpC family hydrolase